MVSFHQAVDYVIFNETSGRIDGALTRDPKDPGGTTKWGIAAASHPGVDIVNLSRADACVIYKREYWDTLSGLSVLVSQRIATKIFDHSVHMGIRGGALAAQRAFNDLRTLPPELFSDRGAATPMTVGHLEAITMPALVEDGDFGLTSAQQVNSVDQAAYTLALVRRLYRTYEKICARRDLTIPGYSRRFLKGFINRAAKLP